MWTDHAVAVEHRHQYRPLSGCRKKNSIFQCGQNLANKDVLSRSTCIYISGNFLTRGPFGPLRVTRVSDRCAKMAVAAAQAFVKVAINPATYTQALGSLSQWVSETYILQGRCAPFLCCAQESSGFSSAAWLSQLSVSWLLSASPGT